MEAVNAEPARIRVEIEKLSLYAQAKGKISASDVEELVVSARKFTVWEMGDLLVELRRMRRSCSWTASYAMASSRR